MTHDKNKKETKIFRKEKEQKNHPKIRDDDDYPQPQQSFKKEVKRRRTNVLKTSRKKGLYERRRKRN